MRAKLDEPDRARSLEPCRSGGQPKAGVNRSDDCQACLLHPSVVVVDGEQEPTANLEDLPSDDRRDRRWQRSRSNSRSEEP